MKEENIKNIKKGILTGAGTAGGAVIGAIVENTINAADVKVRELPETEVVKAIAEEDGAMHEIDETIIVETAGVEATTDSPAPRIPQPKRKPVLVNSVENISELDTESASAIVVEAEIDEEEEEFTEAVVEDCPADEDIMVVSVVPEETEEVDVADYDIMHETETITGMLEDNHDVPDYMDLKDNVTSTVNPNASDLDMPDYVNDANIDSFTNNV